MAIEPGAAQLDRRVSSGHSDVALRRGERVSTVSRTAAESVAEQEGGENATSARTHADPDPTALVPGREAPARCLRR
jgi:hypothetical protein